MNLTNEVNPQMPIIDHSVLCSPNDKNKYYYDVLPNGLRYILISNKEIDKSAVALDVYIGSADDPKEYQGLAHCLEHIIFLGTKKYPNPSEFDNFLNINSGFSNANTSLDHTNYQFEICHDKLEQGIDRFSEFFNEPLFNEDFLNKELNAIESEFKSDYRDDSNRLIYLFLIEGYQNSHFNTFINGNLETLQKKEIREKVNEFYKNKYDPSIMSLCIFSNKEIKELNDLVIKYFSKIKRNVNYKKTPKAILYDNNNMGYLYKLIPIKDISYLVFIWVINKSYNSYYKSEPYNYVISVIGHESRHSLASYLKKKGYIYDLNCIYNETYEVFARITIKIKLTIEGYNNYNEIIKIVLSYINYLQKEEIHKDFFEELKTTSEINFFLDEQNDPIELCEEMSSSLTITKPTDEIFVKNKIEEYRPDLIKEIFDFLTVNNLNIYLLSSKLKENNTNNNSDNGIKYNIEKLYGTEYIKEKKDFSSYIIDIKSNKEIDLAYPELNPFLPKNLNMIDLNICNININDYLFPKKEYDNERIIWYKPNIKYNMPKIYISCEAYISNLNIDYTSYITYFDILIKLIKKELSEFLYLGDTSENSISFSCQLSSILISIEGYNDSIEKYITEYFNNLSKISNIQNIEDIYNKLILIIENIIKIIDNFNLSDVRKQTEYKLNKILREITSKNRLELCHKIKKELENKIIPKEFLSFIKNIFKKVKYEWLIEGNMNFKNSEKIIKKVENELEKIFCEENMKYKEILSVNEIRKQRIINVPENKIYRYNFKSKDNENESSTILLYFQIGNFYYIENNIFHKNIYEQNIKYKSLLFIIHSIFYEIFYDELRTIQQIGYDVDLTTSNENSTFGLYFYITSQKYNPDEMIEKIKNFIVCHDINDENNFSDDDFESYKKSVINELSQKPLTLEEEYLRDFSFISNRTYKFSLRQDLINYINNNITKQDVIDFFNEYIYKNAKILEIALYSSKKNNEQKEDKMDIEENKEIDKDQKGKDQYNNLNNSQNKNKILPSYNNKEVEIINDINDFHRYIKFYDNEFY